MQRTLIVVCLALLTQAQSSSVVPELAPAAAAGPAPTVAPFLGDHVLELHRSRGWASPAFGAGTRDARAALDPALVEGKAELTGPAGWLVPQPGKWPPRAGVAGSRLAREWPPRASLAGPRLARESPPRAGVAGPGDFPRRARAAPAPVTEPPTPSSLSARNRALNVLTRKMLY